jgi:hypothetical protein
MRQSGCFKRKGLMTPLSDFWYYGFRLRTDLPLTGLPRWTGGTGPADIEILQGDVPERLADATWSNRELAVTADRAALVKLRDAGRLLARRGAAARIVLSRLDVSMLEIEGYLLAKVAAVLLHQRGIPLLHASCVSVAGRAVAFSGASGAGKSTIAASLVRSGHRLLSDDITAIRFGPRNSPLAVPGSPHLRLRDDATAAVGVSLASLHPERCADGKRIWRRRLEGTGAVPLAAVFRLVTDPSRTTPALQRLRGTRAIMPMEDILYRYPLAHRLGRSASLAREMLKIAQAIPFYRLIRPPHAAALPAILCLVESAVAGNPTVTGERGYRSFRQHPRKAVRT